MIMSYVWSRTFAKTFRDKGGLVRSCRRPPRKMSCSARVTFNSFSMSLSSAAISPDLALPAKR